MGLCYRRLGTDAGFSAFAPEGASGVRMSIRYGFLAILLLTAPAAAQTDNANLLPSELLQPQPLEQIPALRAPGSTDGLMTQPAAPPPAMTPGASVERPGDAVDTAEPPTRTKAVSEPIRGSAPRQRAEAPRAVPAARAASKRANAAVRAAQRPVSASARSSGRPLAILPAPAQRNAALPAARTSVNAFASEPASPAPPWPFRLGPATPRFDVPGGWW